MFPINRSVKSSIRPQVVYDYTPEVTNYNTPIVKQKGLLDTGSLPTFISPLIKTNTITYTLNNTLTAKNFIGKGKERRKSRFLPGFYLF